MRLFGIRVWPWHKLTQRSSWKAFCFQENNEGGITIEISGWLFYTSDSAERKE